MIEKFSRGQKDELDWFTKSINSFREEHKAKIESNQISMATKIQSMTSELGSEIAKEIESISEKMRKLAYEDE